MAAPATPVKSKLVDVSEQQDDLNLNEELAKALHSESEFESEGEGDEDENSVSLPKKAPPKESESEGEGEGDGDEDENENDQHSSSLPTKTPPKESSDSKSNGEGDEDEHSTSLPTKTQPKDSSDSESEGDEDEDEDEHSPLLLPMKTPPKESSDSSYLDVDGDGDGNEGEHSLPPPTKTPPKESSDSESKGDEDEHPPLPSIMKTTLPIRKPKQKQKQVASYSSPKTKSTGNHISLPSRVLSKNPEDSPTPKARKHSKRVNNEAPPSEEEEQDLREELVKESEGEDSLPPATNTLTVYQPQPQHSSSNIDSEEKESDDSALEGDEHSPLPPPMRKHTSSNIDSQNKAQSKINHVAFEPVNVALPSRASSKRRADFPADHRKGNNDSKRAKKAEHYVNEAVVYNRLKKNKEIVKKNLFKRLWSEEDEIRILNGLIDYAQKNDVVPASVGMNVFYNVIKKSLHMNASKDQMTNKVSKLKKKFQRSLVKGKIGDDRVFSKAHDEKVYQLCNQIWGTEPSYAADEKVLNNLDDEMTVSVSHLKSSAKKVEIEKKWKQLKLKEVELKLQKIELLREVTALEFLRWKN